MPGPDTVFFGLGSNLDDRLEALRRAVEALRRSVTVDAVSPVYETTPMYVTDQPAFLNAVVQARSARHPEALLDLVKGVEAALGRRPRQRFGPREIDIDVLLVGRQVYVSERMEVPHPRLLERRFVLQPLLDLAPAVVHPAGQGAMAALLAGLPDAGSVQVYAEQI